MQKSVVGDPAPDRSRIRSRRRAGLPTVPRREGRLLGVRLRDARASVSTSSFVGARRDVAADIGDEAA